MQISNSGLCESSKCWVYSAVNHPWWMSMLFHRRGFLWLGSAVRYKMKANCIYQLITLKLRRLRSIVVIKCSSLFSYNTLTWTLILTIRHCTPEYITGTGELFSEVDRNVVWCDYDRTILGGSFYSVILFQRFHSSR